MIRAKLLVPVVAFASLCTSAFAQAGHNGSIPTPPPFTVRNIDGRYWLQRPNGGKFFSSGVCCVEPGEPWGEYDPAKPAYSAWREHPTIMVWSSITLARLKSWGFTTVGGWSDYAGLKRSAEMDMPYTMVLHLGSSSGAPWWNMWDPKIIGAMDKAAHDQILPVRSDPRLLGYYTDNELGWWNAPLFEMTLEQAESSEQRRRLISILRDEYANSWSRLTRDFAPAGAASFDDLSRKGKLYLKPSSSGIHVVKRFVSMIAERYYTLVNQIVRKYDTRALILGDRYQSFYYPEVARASSRMVDVVSTNLNPSWIDGAYPRFLLNTLHTITNRSITVGEFYMCSIENRSGNKNSSSGFPLVATQADRARGFIGTLNALASTPFVVGADWFQYADEPTFGRGDGENYNMGLVDINDRPYEEMTVAAAAFRRDEAHARAEVVQTSALEGVPTAPANPMADWKPQHAMLTWDRLRGFIPASTPEPLGDMYICWAPDSIYLGVYAMDVLEQGLYSDKQIPEADRPVWTITVGGASPPIRIRLGAGRKPIVENRGVNLEVVDTSGTESGVYHAAAIRLPAALFGKAALMAGDSIQLKSTYRTHARAYSMAWQALLKLAK